jgi:hypothetical protein
MSPGRTIRTAVAFVLLLACGARGSLGDNAGQPDPDAQIGRILSDWERRSSERSGLDVRFVREDHDRTREEKKNYTGRVVLLPKGPALVEMMNQDRPGRLGDSERLVWTTDEFHQIRPEQKTQFVWPIAEKDRNRLPAVLALPFFWHLSAEGLKSRYRIELLKERPEIWLLRIKPLSEVGRQSFSAAYLDLDRSTFLPRR